MPSGAGDVFMERAHAAESEFDRHGNRIPSTQPFNAAMVRVMRETINREDPGALFIRMHSPTGRAEYLNAVNGSSSKLDDPPTVFKEHGILFGPCIVLAHNEDPPDYVPCRKIEFPQYGFDLFTRPDPRADVDWATRGDEEWRKRYVANPPQTGVQ